MMKQGINTWVESEPSEFVRQTELLRQEYFLSKLSGDKIVLKKSLKSIKIWEEILVQPPPLASVQRLTSIFETYRFPYSSDFNILSNTSEWEVQIQAEIKQIVLKYKWDDFKHLVKKSIKGKKAQKLNRILVVQKQIETLVIDFNEHFDFQLVSTIRRLAQELHALLCFYYSRQKRYLLMLRLSKQNFYLTKVRDLRRQFRCTVHTMFKCFPDFSGSEEEVNSNRTIAILFPNFQNQKNVTYRIFNKCYQQSN